MEVSSDPLSAIIEVVLIVLILILLAFINAADKAIDAVSHSAIREMAKEGDVRAKRLVTIFKKPSNYMAAAKVLLVFGGFLTGWFFVKRLIAGEFLSSLSVPPLGREILLVLIAGAIFTLVVVTLVIIVPRQIANRHAEGVALALSGYALFFSRLCRPFVALDRGVAGGILAILRQGRYEEEDEFSEDEVMSMLEVGQESGVIKEEGRKMIDSIFAFDDKLAYEIMTPRTDVFSIDLEDEVSEYLDDLMQMRYSRIPAYREDSDNIIGILNIKDFLIKAREVGFDKVDVEEILREPFFVPDTKNIDSLFFELQTKKQHIAILIDEYGGFSGIVTMEDIIEEVMGEIDDEFDEEEADIKQVNYNTYLVDGNTDLDDLNEEIGTDFYSDNSETLGGLLIDILGEIPAEDEEREVEVGRYLCIIQSVKDRRVEQVKLIIRDEEDMAKQDMAKQDSAGQEETNEE